MTVVQKLGYFEQNNAGLGQAHPQKQLAVKVLKMWELSLFHKDRIVCECKTTDYYCGVCRLLMYLFSDVAQVILNMVAYSMGLSAAIEKPRFQCTFNSSNVIYDREFCYIHVFVTPTLHW